MGGKVRAVKQKHEDVIMVKTGRLSFAVDEATISEAKKLGVNVSKAARDGVLAEIRRQRKLLPAKDM